MKKILAVGSPLIDVLLNVSDSFIDSLDGDKGGMQLVENADITSLLKNQGHSNDKVVATGGSAANTTLGLLKLGYKEASFLGKIADDENGNLFANTFNALGNHRFKYCNDLATGSCLSLITPDAQRTMRTYLGASVNLSKADITLEDFSCYDHIHLEGYLLFNRHLALHILSVAKQAHCSVSLDLASFEVVNANKDILVDVLTKYVDVLFANEDEAEALVGHTDVKKTLKELQKYCSVVAVKLGAEGAYISIDNDIIYQKAEKIVAIDTTGAGDLWASGFLYGYLQEKPLKQTLELAAKLGASVVQNTGAFLTDEQWKEVKI